jgi:hypothetical protein
MIVKIKKIIAVLLVVLFLATVTASAVSANYNAPYGNANGQSGHVPSNGHQGYTGHAGYTGHEGYTGHATGADLHVS